MAINLKPVDVAVVGLGAAGGVAVLPLARAGLKVAGIEAGTWMDPAKDFKPDEIHNNVRGLVTTVPKAKKEIPTFRTSPDAQARQGADASDDERRRRHVDPLSRAKLAAEAVGFQDALGNHQTLRREFASRKARRWRTGPSATTNWSRTTTPSSTRSACRARRATFKASSIRRATFTKARGSASIPMPPLRTCDFLDHMQQGREVARVEAVSRALGDQLAALSRAGGLRVSRLLRSRRVPRQREEFDLLHHHSRSAENQEPDGVRQRAGDADRRGQQRQSHRRTLHSRRQGIFSAGQSCAGEFVHLRKYAAACCSRNPRRIRTDFRTITARWASTISAIGTRRRAWALRRCSPMDINTWYGAMLSQGVVVDEWADDTFDHSGLGFIGGASLCTFMEKHPIAAASMRYLRPRARVGFQMEAVRA